MNVFKTSAKVAILSFVALKAYTALMEVTQEEHTFNPFQFPDRKSREIHNGDPLDNYFLNKDGLYIFWQKWLPQGQPKAVVVLCHGFGEYSSRYESFAKRLTANGFAVFALDHQGHGRSEGDRAYTKSFQDLIDDLVELTNKAKKEFPSSKFVLLGHSMGGNIALQTVLQNPQMFSEMVLSSPALSGDPNVVTPTMITIANFLGGVMPKLQLDKLPIETLCGNPSVVDLYVNDPLIYTGGLSARISSEFLTSFRDLPPKYQQVQLPYLLVHGRTDGLVPYAGSVEFHEKTTSKDKTFLSYDFGHEMLNERDSEVTDAVVDWLNKHN